MNTLWLFTPLEAAPYENLQMRQEGVAQYAAIAADLERVLPAASAPGRGRPGGEDALAALPGALANLHGLLMHVAARLDGLHDRLADSKQAHLDQLAVVRRPTGGCMASHGRLLYGEKGLHPSICVSLHSARAVLCPHRRLHKRKGCRPSFQCVVLSVTQSTQAILGICSDLSLASRFCKAAQRSRRSSLYPCNLVCVEHVVPCNIVVPTVCAPESMGGDMCRKGMTGTHSQRRRSGRGGGPRISRGGSLPHHCLLNQLRRCGRPPCLFLACAF